MSSSRIRRRLILTRSSSSLRTLSLRPLLTEFSNTHSACSLIPYELYSSAALPTRLFPILSPLIRIRLLLKHTSLTSSLWSNPYFTSLLCYHDTGMRYLNRSQKTTKHRQQRWWQPRLPLRLGPSCPSFYPPLGLLSSCSYQLPLIRYLF